MKDAAGEAQSAMFKNAMEEITTLKTQALREQLESAAAQILGQMLFEFSRLDTALGLCAVWVGEGRRLEELNPRVNEISFHKRLDFLQRAAEARFKLGSEAMQKYEAWFGRVQAARMQRNELVHGRWGVEPLTMKVVNVMGLPTSNQRAVKYTMPELGKIIEDLRALRMELGHLRQTWPL